MRETASAGAQLTWDSVDRAGFLWDHKVLHLARSAVPVTQMLPANLTCGVERNKWEGYRPGRGETLSPQKHTQGQEQTYRAERNYQEKYSPEGSMTAEQERERPGSISLKGETKENICSLGSFLLSLVIISMFSEMKCLKTTNQHRETLFFSFETTLKNTVCCLHHPWGLYLI